MFTSPNIFETHVLQHAELGQLDLFRGEPPASIAREVWQHDYSDKSEEHRECALN